MLLALALSVGAAACGADDSGTPAPALTAGQGGAGSSSTAVLTGTQPLLNGEPQQLSAYRGDVVLVVNTATECGFTPQFDGLERLYRFHRDDGFVILGFPADDVAHQEPRDDQQIAEFCKENFGVSFPMFAKSNVVSEPMNPVFEKLNADAGPPTWNFNKYLLDRDGRVVEHYDAGTAPDDAALNARISALLRT
ncbi:MAG: glutathione peroxidase [Solirubrobacterales bacterium]|jgi:glutathione peroxidase|nr:glutathione peroxidase [Solirubrobacterales bacterium]